MQLLHEYIFRFLKDTLSHFQIEVTYGLKLTKTVTMCGYYLIKFTLRWLHIAKVTAGNLKSFQWSCSCSDLLSAVSHLDTGWKLVCHIALQQVPLSIIHCYVEFDTCRSSPPLLVLVLKRLSHLPPEMVL